MNAAAGYATSDGDANVSPRPRNALPGQREGSCPEHAVEREQPAELTLPATATKYSVLAAE